MSVMLHTRTNCAGEIPFPPMRVAAGEIPAFLMHIMHQSFPQLQKNDFANPQLCDRSVLRSHPAHPDTGCGLCSLRTPIVSEFKDSSCCIKFPDFVFKKH